MNQTTWKEEKLDNPQIVHQFQVVSGPSMPGSKTVRLKMKDQNTEVLLLDSSAQVFVNGNYFGEYAGEWQNGSKARAAPQAKQQAAPPQAAAPPPAAAPAAAKGNSKQPAAPPAGDQGAAFEQTLVPEQAKGAAKKAAPPPAAIGGGGGGGGAPPVSMAGVKSYPGRDQFAPWQAPGDQRPRKAEGLDKSDASIQKLINAAKNGDVNQVKQLLTDGIDPDGPAKDGQTPLMAATRGGHTAVVEALLGACADPTMGKGDETPLTIAFNKGNQNLLKVLFAGSFTNLNGLVGPGDISIPAGMAEDETVPEHAEYELREMTARIAAMSRSERATSPQGGGKYGNYSHLTASMDMEDKDADDLRQEGVRQVMRNLVKTAKAEGIGTGSPVSPGRA
jgi:hypothetical protein